MAEIQDPSNVNLPPGQQPIRDTEGEQSVAEELAAQGEFEEFDPVTGKKRKAGLTSAQTEKRAKTESGEVTTKRATDAEADTIVEGAKEVKKADYHAGVTKDLHTPRLPRNIGGPPSGNAFLQLGAAIGAKLASLHTARMQMEIRFLDQHSKTRLAQLIYDLETVAAEIKKRAEVEKAKGKFAEGLTQAIGGGIQAATSGVSMFMSARSMSRTSRASKLYKQEMGTVDASGNKTSKLKRPPSTIDEAVDEYKSQAKIAGETTPQGKRLKAKAEHLETVQKRRDTHRIERQTQKKNLDKNIANHKQEIDDTAELDKELRSARKDWTAKYRGAEHDFQKRKMQIDAEIGLAHGLTDIGRGVSAIITGAGQMYAADQNIAAAELEELAETTKAYAKLLDNVMKMIDTNIQDLVQSIVRALDIARSVSELPLNTKLF